LSIAKAGLARGRSRQSLAPLRAVCEELPVEFEAPELAEAREILAA
jgi:hypothetical protein